MTACVRRKRVLRGTPVTIALVPLIVLVSTLYCWNCASSQGAQAHTPPTASHYGSLQVTYASTDASGVETYGMSTPYNGPGVQSLRILPPTHPASGMKHNFLFVLPVEAGLGTTYGDGLETVARLNAQNRFNLTVVEPTFAVDPWYANDLKQANRQYETFMTRQLVPWVRRNLSTSGVEQVWLLGFSKSGLGGQDLLLKHPGVFSLAASWDFPADMTQYHQYGAVGYGTQASFASQYELTPTFVASHKGPFTHANRIWIGGGEVFHADVTDYNALLTRDGMKHSNAPIQHRKHTWGSGWVPAALSALHADSQRLSER